MKKEQIHVALDDKGEESVSVNVGVVSKRKPHHVMPLIHNIEEDINVQETSDDDGKESKGTTTSNTDFEGVRLEYEEGMDISIDWTDCPDSRESMA